MVRKEYKKAEVGEIPEDWDAARLGKLCGFQNGTAQESLFNRHEGYNVVSIGNYSEAGQYVHTGSFISKSMSLWSARSFSTRMTLR